MQRSSGEAVDGSSPRVRGKPDPHREVRARRRLIPACAGKTTRKCGRLALPAAHPRVCGENHVTKARVQEVSGSSPRVRGKHDVIDDPAAAGRLIPACAGKTASSRRAARRWMGSSPRVRGKRRDPRRRHGRGRLIPACAGKTGAPPRRREGTWAHPRVCGENDLPKGGIDLGLGSSPRVRGKPRRHHERDGGEGLIPACAGKTGRGRGGRTSTPAHPRVCGENPRRCASRSRSTGSSPRVRGKQSGGVLSHGGLRLIPACAGKTPRRGRSARACAAHPRVCGENQTSSSTTALATGSSPRVRGKLIPRRGKHHVHGLIPACAGKTRRPDRRHPVPWAHPRVCGENPCDPRPFRERRGSSPRVRGKRTYRFLSCSPVGLIPACAGKTPIDGRPSRMGQAHPRVCGENTGCTGELESLGGSSPRVRGKPRRGWRR